MAGQPPECRDHGPGHAEMHAPGHHRWVLSEPDIPFDLPVLYEDEAIIVVDKPHFLATMPRGMWYRQTALMRLRERYNDPRIVPAHRLDRPTAGVLVFVRNPAARGAYQLVFQNRRARKVYECLAPVRVPQQPHTGTVVRLAAPRPFPLERRSHIVKTRGVLCAQEIPGVVNAVTRIERAELDRAASARAGEPIARYVLHPQTGKTHQLRVHMNALGLPILGDDFYPRIEQRAYDDFSQPLELVARVLEFRDPLTGEPRRFVSRVPLGAAISRM